MGDRRPRGDGMSYDIRYKIGDLVDLENDERGRNPWRVACIFIHGDEGIVDESQRVSYNLVSLAGDAGRGAFNHEIRPSAAVLGGIGFDVRCCQEVK